MNLYTSLTLRYLRENKKRTIVTIIGIILSTALICGIGNIYGSYMDYQVRETVKGNGSFHATFYDVKKDSVDYITKSSGLEEAGLSSNLGAAEINSKYKNILQVKEYNDSMFKGYNISLIEGRLPKSSNEIVMGEESLKILNKNYKIGDEITLSIGKRVVGDGEEISGAWRSEDEYIKDAKEKTFKLVGIIEKPGFEYGDSVTTGITYLDASKLSSDKSINVSIKAKNPKDIYEIVPKIIKNANIEAKVVEGTENDQYPLYENIDYNEHLLRLQGASYHSNINDSINTIVAIVTSLVVVCTVATVYNSFSISISERKKQFGILNSIGATNSQVINMVLIEGIIVSIIAIPIGLACGTLAMDIVFKVIGKLFSGSFIADMNLRIVYNPSIIILSSVTVLITIFISIILPAMSAAKISPLDAIKNSSDYKVGKVKDSKLVRLLLKTEGVLAYKNLRRNKKKFRITLFSLVISIVIFISFSGFMKIFMKAQDVMSVKMTYDISLSSSGEVAKMEGDNIVNEIKNIPGINNFATNQNSYMNIDLKVNKNKINKNYKELIEEYHQKEEEENDYIFNNNSIKYPGDYAINNLNLKEGSYDKETAIKENGIVLVNKSYYEGGAKKGEVSLTNYKVGDIIEGYYRTYDEKTEEEKEVKLKFKVMAITDDLVPGSYGYDQGLGIIVYDEIANKLGFESINDSIHIETNKSDDTIKAIKEVADKYGYTVYDKNEAYLENIQSAYAMQVFVYGFITVISLVSITNIVNTISTNINLRKRELAIIQSIGVTPQGFNKMIYLESFLYGVLSLIYGVPMGLGISLLILNVLGGVVEFGIVLPLEAVLISVVGIFVITFIASYIPMKKINKENIIDNIRQDCI